MALERNRIDTSYSPPAERDVGIGFRAEAANLQVGINNAQAVSDTAFQRAAKGVELSGQLAGTKDGVQFDDKGNLLPLTQLPTNDTIYGRSFREAAITSYGQAATTAARKMADDIARTHYNDPEGARTAWNAYQTQTLTAMHKDVAPFVANNLVSIGGDMFSQIADQHAVAVRLNGANDAKLGIAQSQKDLAGRLANMPLSSSSMTVVQDFVATQIAPAVHQLGQIDSVNYGEAVQKGMLQEAVKSGISTLVQNTAIQQGSGTFRDATGRLQVDTGKAASYLEKAYHTDGLDKLFTPDEFKQVTSDALGKVNLLAAGREASFTAEYSNQLTAGEANAGSVQAAIAKGDIALRNGDAGPLTAAYDAISHMTFSPSPSQNIAIQNQMRAQISGIRSDIMNNPTLYTVFQLQHDRAALQASSPGAAFNMPPGAAGEMLASQDWMNMDKASVAATGQHLSLSTFDPQLVHTVMRFSAFAPAQIAEFNSIRGAKSENDLRGLTANLAQAIGDDPQFADKLNKDVAEYALAFNRSVNVGGMGVDDFKKDWALSHNPLATSDAAKRSTAALDDSNNTTLMTTNLSTGLTKAIGGSSYFQRNLDSALGRPLNIAGDIVPGTLKESGAGFALRIGTLGLSTYLPDPFVRRFLFGGVNTGMSNLKVELTGSAVTAYSADRYHHYLNEGSTTADTNALSDLAVRGYALSGFLPPGNGKPIDTGAYYFGRGGPEQVYSISTAAVGEAVAHDLDGIGKSASPNMLENYPTLQQEILAGKDSLGSIMLHHALGNAQAAPPNWHDEVVRGNIRLDPVFINQGGKDLVSGYLMIWVKSDGGYVQLNDSRNLWHYAAPEPDAATKANNLSDAAHGASDAKAIVNLLPHAITGAPSDLNPALTKGDIATQAITPMMDGLENVRRRLFTPTPPPAQ